MKVSVFIITYNAAHIIEKCLQKLTWCDEIIIVDSGSTDTTISICKEYNAKIYYKDFNGFGLQKQYALSLCNNEWVLNLDADEILSNDLIKEIQYTLNNNKNDNISGYYLKMRMVFLGKIFHYGNESNRNIMRLFKKSNCYYTKDIVHEQVIIKGKTATLKSHFLHYSYTSIKDYIDKLNNYSTLGAKKAFLADKKYSLFKILISPIFHFIRKYFINFNIANGKKGFYWCILSSFHDFIKYIKIEEKHNKKVL